jgi:hypothetical protein
MGADDSKTCEPDARRGVIQEMRRALIPILLALLAAACGTEGASRVSGDRTPTPSPSDYSDQAVEWYLKSISADGREVAFVYMMSGVASGCERAGTAKVVETDAKVAIEAFKSVTTDRDRPCTEEAAFVDETVALETPLGSRALVGCRPPSTDASEDAVCRDLQRSRDFGVLGPPTAPPDVPDGPAPKSTAKPTPQAAPSGYERKDVEWFIRSIDNDNGTLEITYQTGGCDRDGGATAKESSDKVVVDAWKFVRTGTGFACTADIRESNATVTLDAPLGDRALVGCRPGKEAVSENQVCRDANRGPF